MLTNLLKEASPSRLLRIVSTDFLALRLLQYTPARPPNLIF